MKLYLSSFRLGNNPELLLRLLSENKKAGIIMNAVDDASGKIREEKFAKEVSDLQSIGIASEELDLRRYFGKKETLRNKLSEYGMVWVRGGNTFILRRAFSYSGFDDILREKISDKYFVYAGYSAGICVITPSLHGLDIVDHPNIIPEGYQSEVIWDGVGLLSYAIEPHYRSDHLESLLIEKEISYLIDNKILFKALHDGEVIIETL